MLADLAQDDFQMNNEMQVNQDVINANMMSNVMDQNSAIKDFEAGQRESYISGVQSQQDFFSQRGSFIDPNMMAGADQNDEYIQPDNSFEAENLDNPEEFTPPV